MRKKEQAKGEQRGERSKLEVSQEGKRARVEVKWMLGREENGKNWKRIGRIEKSVIPIFLIQLVTICNRLIH